MKKEKVGHRSLAFIHLLMLICALLVSTSFIVGKSIAASMDPVLLTLVRFSFATLILYPYVQYRHNLLVGWTTVWRCALISSTLVMFFWCMFLALRYTTALNTSILFTLVPSMAGFYAMILVKERLNLEKGIALFCGIVGAVWVVFKGEIADFLAMQWNIGDLIFLAGCLAMGLYTPLVKLLHRGEPMVVMTFWILATGTVWLLLASLPSLPNFNIAEIPLATWLGVAYLSLFTTVISFFLTQYSIPYIGPTKVMAYSYLYPALVLFLDIAIGNTWPGFQVVPGVLIVLVAMFVLQRSEV